LNRFYFCFILLFAIANHSFAQNNVTIEEIRGYNEDACWFCAGKLVVSNGSKTDTIKGGQYGKPPNYRIIKIKSIELLVLEGDYSYPMGERIKTIQILFLDNEHFLKEIFAKTIKLEYESYSDDGSNEIIFTYKNDPTIELEDNIWIRNNITVERCPVTEDELDFECYSIFEFKEIEFIDLGKLLSHKK
jgi:hypothetical protein